MRGEVGLYQLIYSIKDSVSKFAYLPIPLFILMGEVMFRSGVAYNMIDALDKWLDGAFRIAVPGAETREINVRCQ